MKAKLNVWNEEVKIKYIAEKVMPPSFILDNQEMINRLKLNKE